MRTLYVLLAVAGVVLVVVWYQNRNTPRAGGGYVPQSPTSGSGLLDSLTLSVAKIRTLFDTVVGRSTVPPAAAGGASA